RACYPDAQASALETTLVMEHDRVALEADEIRVASVNAKIEVENDRIGLEGGLADKASLVIEDRTFSAKANHMKLDAMHWRAEASQSATLHGATKLVCTSRGTTEIVGGKTNIHGRPIHLNPPGGGKAV